MKKNLILAILISANTYVFSQNERKCNTTQLTEKELQSNPDYKKGRVDYVTKNIAWMEKNNTDKSIITIPIVIHIIHKNTHPNIGSGTNISNAQIEDAIQILNEDYSKTNPEFPNPPRNTYMNYWGNPNMKFCLATIDPDGNSTNGITRTSTTKTSFDADSESDDMKKNSTLGKDGWDPSKYLNIWVCNISNQGSGEILGYAYPPGLPSWSMWKDGFVVDYKYFGTIGIASSNSDSRTPTHEIGHYLGLMHTFCTDKDAQGNYICCDNDNDIWGNYVDDTPATEGIYWYNVTASTNNNTCNDTQYANTFTTDVLDMDENFMSYASNTWMFSTDQVDVMVATLNGYRSSLKNSTVSMNCDGSVGTGLNNYQLENLNIYPNPTLGKLNIVSADKINTLSITNIIGKELLFAKDFLVNTIDLSSFESGVYFINISTDKGTHIEKIILTK